jgi:hypothetical protein
LSRSKKRPKLVVITWRDIVAYSDWTPVKDVKIPVLKTIGYLIKKDKDQIILAHTQDEKGEWFGLDAYPRGCVSDIKPISE